MMRPLQPGRINAILYSLMERAFEELSYSIHTGIKGRSEDFRSLQTQIEVHAAPYADARAKYEKAMSDLDARYGRNRIMTPPETIERMQTVINLAHEIGSFQLGPRYAPVVARPVDEYIFTAFEYDVSGISDSIPLVHDLVEFYYRELMNEFERRPDSLRRREAILRGKRAYVFYQKYKAYEKSGFDTSRIEEIFGISDHDQEILNFWIDELLAHGSATLIFAGQGKGKSNTGAFATQAVLIMRPEWDILTNIQFAFVPGEGFNPEYQIDRVKFVWTLKELLSEDAKSILAQRYPAVIIDEFDTSYSAPETRTKKGMGFKAYVYVERHLDNKGPLLIYHRHDDIPVEMRELSVAHATYKTTWYTNHISKRRRRCIVNPTSWNSGTPGGYRYFPTPLSSIPYLNQGSSPIDITDVNMKWINAHAKGSKEKVAAWLLKILPMHPWDSGGAEESGKSDPATQ